MSGTLARRLGAWVVGCGVVGLAVAGLWIASPLPVALLAPEPQQSLTLADRHGLALRTTRAGDGSLNRWFRLEEMDPDLPRAFVAVEDRRFYQHHGVDLRAVLRATRDNLAHRAVVSGASTITMQLARLLRPIGHGPLDKLVQTLWALRLEAHLEKPQILEQYLNRVPLGQGAVGIAAAARVYFGRAPGGVSLGQAALLAGLARAPSSQNPLVAPHRAAQRRRAALARLAGDGYAAPEEIDRALREPLVGDDRGRPFLAPHFASRVLQEGAAAGRPAAGIWRTSLDLELQAALEDEVRHTVEQLRDRGARQAALVVLDNGSGEVLAWVGSPDFWADTAGQVDMVVSRRQPGSALKPFLYALAFDRGTTAATVLADIATTYQTSGGPYHPRNYDRAFHGPVRAREALASSYNVPAVELANRIGYATLLHGLQAGGFASLDRSPEHYGLGLALGNGDVTLLELANGYRALANGGLWTPARWWAGEPDQPSGAGRRIVSPRAAALALDVLADPEARIPAFGLGTPFDWPFRVAAKTGTSRHFTDNWAVAVTAGFTVGVWVGNFNGQPMEGVSGITGAGPLIHRAVLVTGQRYPAGNLPTATEAGLLPARICRLSGALAGPDCPPMIEYFLPGTLPAARCGWHRDGQVELPIQYAEWAATSRAGPPSGRVAAPPTRRGAAPSARLTITSPLQGDHYEIPPGVDGRYATIALRVAGAPAGAPVQWLLDGHPLAASRWALVPGRHQVRVVAGSLADSVEITVTAAGPPRGRPAI